MLCQKIHTRIHTMRMLFAVALLIGFLATTNTAAHPIEDPTPTPTPESEEIKRLREEKTRAELEKDIAVAEKAKFDAEFPKPSTSPLSGETKINEGAVIESEMVSY